MARPRRAPQTPPLGHLLAVGAPSGANSLRIFGRTLGAPGTSYGLCFRGEQGGDSEAANGILEALARLGDAAQEP